MTTDGTGAKRLLAVDDHADSAELVARIARKCGYEAQSSSDPTAVRRLVQTWAPSILSLDLCMPDTDGVELIDALHEVGFAGDLIIVSGQSGQFREMVGRLAQAKGLRVVAHMSKPIDLQHLRTLLRDLWAAT